ncbi:MAG: carbon-nitrogen hydrolase family protein [Planctomycetes bacterium]|nr:carbon-nitrogen hydrolase family protein [Planctomycetota bacterium]MBL7043859.1 carbon-nitrogen hydrolase family protein [Pirellulaceae bacterium]
MRKKLCSPVVLTILCLFYASLVALANPADKELPGRPVRVAAVCIGCGGNREAKLRLGLDHLETAGQCKVDIVCLPEEFAGFAAEPIPGPTTRAIAEMAKKYKMYVICPIREQAGEKQYNTAVLIDREGKIVGQYRKVFVYWGEGLHLSDEGVKTFDTDFGRISILTCFDINFAELWHEADLLDAEIVFWPSAYGGGCPLNAYAMAHNYYVVPVGNGNIIDCTGNTLEKLDEPRPKQFIATLDLDRTFVHTNFNRDKVNRLLKEHADDVEQERFYPMESWYLLRAIKPGTRVRDLCKEYGIESLREYRHRSRREINQARKEGRRI